MLVFGNTPGVVGTVVGGPALPFAVVVGGNPGVAQFGPARVMKAVLTGFDLAGKSGLGVSHSLQDKIHVYVFGERMGQAAVSGVAFAGFCQGDPRYTGLDAVYDYYERVRVSTQGLVVRLVFGPATVLYGFLSDFNFKLADPESGMGTFGFGFQTAPRWAAFAPPGAGLADAELRA